MADKSFIERFFGHLNTINKHKLIVSTLCIKCGLVKQGLLHDLSKYSYVEFSRGVKYFQGYRSPIDKEKEELGYALGWLHHKGRNKHHWDFWVDRKHNEAVLEALPMPFNYVLESVCDKIGASKVYAKEKYHDYYAYEFFMNSKERLCMNEKSARQIEELLKYLGDNGEEKALKYYKSLYQEYKKNKVDPI